ncbi:sulfatase [Echinicola sp. CAU 1574]|uniref:Sulfatase n=1 Tax=Echinicola arenosa TaxID=2774144 RepID=A0ABR9AL52_9BACT|nr:sulfatase [Echinicola arenosa]MBD8489518.1 sulfatase [Echinicola arenosa]
MKKIIPLLTGLLLLGVWAFTDSQEKPKAKQVPNILFAIMDDVTYMHMGAYGCDWVKTPNFDRIAAEGILFNNAYTPNAKCAPSRSNILTGRNSWQLEEAANHWPYFPAKFKTFAEVLDEHGYHVGYTGKGWAPGVAKHEDGSPRNLLVHNYSELKTTPPTPQISNVDYAGNFEAFLNEKNDDEPFFFWYGGLEPHRGYEYGSGIDKGGKSIHDVGDDQVYSFWPSKDSVKTDLLDYAYEIEYFDKQLGKMLDELEKRGELENTLIVVTSDNGMPFPRIKGQEYEYSNHLPLAVRWGDGISTAGRKIDDFISFIDFAPTFLELAGIKEKESGMKNITGNSFTDILYSSKSKQVDPKRDHVLIGKERHDVGRPEDHGYPIRGIVKGDLLYLQNFEPDRWPAGNPKTGYLNTDGGATKTVCLNSIYNESTFQYWAWSFGKRPAEELYNINEDPDCIHNLADNGHFKKEKDALKKKLFKELKAQADPRMYGKGNVFDAYKYADQSGIDFYSRYMDGEEMRAGWVNKNDFQNLEKLKPILMN